MNYEPRVDDRGYAVHLPSGHLLPLNSSLGDDQEEVPPSRHLWVGNVSQEVTEGLLVEKFSPFGSIESVTVYSQRNYAFINFKDVENAQTAKNGLQGIVLGGLALRIESAKGVILCHFPHCSARREGSSSYVTWMWHMVTATRSRKNNHIVGFWYRNSST